MTARRCGDCQLCCRLLPTAEIAKPANERCPHQRHGVGCAIYADRPLSCRLWSCGWLTQEDAASLPRPDRAHYVIDPMPDYITITPDGGEPEDIPVIQVWVDPQHRDAHRAESFRRWLDERRLPAIIRYNSKEGFVLFPPSVSNGHGWVEHRTGKVREQPSTLRQKAAALGGELVIDEGNGVRRATLTVGGTKFTIAAEGPDRG
jgi:hypothetical protein